MSIFATTNNRFGCFCDTFCHYMGPVKLEFKPKKAKIAILVEESTKEERLGLMIGS